MFNIDDFRFGNPLCEFFNEIIRRLGNNFFWSSDLDDFTITHDSDPITDGDSFIQIVSDKNYGLLNFALQKRKFFPHLTTYQWI